MLHPLLSCQVMAIATLERCYNNPAVFRGVVKIRKGEAVRMMMEATDLDSVKSILNHFTKQVCMHFMSKCGLNKIGKKKEKG